MFLDQLLFDAFEVSGAIEDRDLLVVGFEAFEKLVDGDFVAAGKNDSAVLAFSMASLGSTSCNNRFSSAMALSKAH